MSKTVISTCPEETEALGTEFAKSLNRGSFIALYGDLGAGKTAFVRGVAKHICPTERVFSPTYTVVNEYLGGDIPLYHFDLYRITDEDDLYSTGFYDYIENGICICEWCENIPYAIPRNAVCVKIEKITENGEVSEKRVFTFYESKQEMNDENIGS